MPSLNGLILAGGSSRRMGQIKGLLDYHGMPQYEYAAGLLSAFTEQVFISCRIEQRDLFPAYPMICDEAVYGDIGPLNGVLSAFNRSEGAWFVLGCDYPLLTGLDLNQLRQARNPRALATVFSNASTGRPEPLIGIYEAGAGPLLRTWFRQGEQSLRRFLEQHDTHLVTPANPNNLRSVDAPDELEQIRKSLKKHGS